MLRKPTPIETIYQNISEKQGQRLFDEIVNAELPQPRLTLPAILAYLVSTIVILSSLGFVVLGFRIIVSTWFSFVTLLGIVCLLLGWAMRPRLNLMPKGVLKREEHKELYGLVDEIAEEMNAPRIDGIVVSERYTASFGRYGWRNQKILEIGLLLWYSIGEKERVALLAHEMAHSVNGDVLRTGYVAMAMNSLSELCRSLHAPPSMTSSGCFALLDWLTGFLFHCLSYIPFYAIYILLMLLGSISQRAEYLADYLASSVSGTDALVSLLRCIYLNETNVSLECRRMYANPELRTQDLFARLQTGAEGTVIDVDDRPLDLAENAMASTHPPIGYRIRFCESHPFPTGKIGDVSRIMERIDSELGPVKVEMQNKLIDRHLGWA
jgi:heat shock protein HtpX